VQLQTLVEVSSAVGATRSRTRKIALLADALHALAPEERDIGVAYLAGVPRQDRLDLGPAAVYGEEVTPADAPSLTLRDVDAALQAIADVPAGTGSRRARIDRLHTLLAAATAEEQPWLRSLVLRELRQGALEGLLVQAIAAAAEVPEPAVRRAAMITGDLRRTAHAALTDGSAGLAAFRLEVGVPLQPMLASTAADVASALEGLDEVVVEAKLDGARVQVHRDGDDVAVFTRTLHDVTARVPEVVEAVRSLPVDAIVLDGEALAFDTDGRPRPFQETMQRFGRERDLDDVLAEVPLAVRFFDVLHLDGQDLLDRPLSARLEALTTAVPGELRVDQVVTSEIATAADFVTRTLRAGHEGAMVKGLDVPYEAGRRGAGWRKVKPVHTLDLVVLAAEWGSGRRRGWLSNLHLGARADDPEAGFVMLGKTFKGLTDEVLTWQTEALLERETGRSGHVVHVAPELVVEIAFDGLVRSTRYPGGVALRFARVRGYRPDKPASEADRLATVHAIHRGERLPDL
jgi:DNA ligase 1